MTINLNVPIRLLIRILRALERISHNYELVHQHEIAAASYDHHLDKKVGRTFYQNDEALYQEEIEAKVRATAARML